MLPDLVVHADWSINDRKRWMVCAHRTAAGYRVEAPEPVGDLSRFLQRLRMRAGPDACVLAGFDFPIGLPEAYAEKAGIVDYLAWLPQLGQGDWLDFDHAAESAVQISLYRPFYPARPGQARQAHLLEALGVSGLDDLRRVCERAHPGRRPAAPLFWTMGSQQVGKAALCGWRNVLLPALSSYNARIWPFSGHLVELLQPGGLVLAEIYPAEFYSHLGLNFKRMAGRSMSKRSRAARLAQVEALLDWQERAGVSFTPVLDRAVRDGFGSSPEGEDCFDALVGVLGMINILVGHRPLWEPDQWVLRRVEGWIFGQAVSPREKA